jgi:hypothetical protein
MADFGPRRPPRRLRQVVAGALGVLAAAVPAGAQFVLWDSFPVANPFSVTAAARGVSPSPSLELEAIVGFFNGSTNQFVYHATSPLTASEPAAGIRRVDTTQSIDFLDFGVQSAFNGLCCSNNAIGITDDSSLHAASNFSAGTSSEILIGTPESPESVERPFRDDRQPDSPPGPFGIGAIISAMFGIDPAPFVAEGSPDGTISFRRVAVGSLFPGAGLPIYSIDGAPGTPEDLETTLTDCQGVSSNWHFTMDRSDDLDESYVACVKTNGNFVVKRVALDPVAVSEIPLASGVGTTSSIFAYLHVAACPIATGTVVGTLIPRQSLGTTTFFATYLDGAGAVVGTSQVTLPGARANHQAYYCRSDGALATFVYHGTGESPTTTTDTFVVETGEASLDPPAPGGTSLLVHRVTENRRTDWADRFVRRLATPAGATIELDYRGPDPVAEMQSGVGSQVRYGGIAVPIFFHDFESGDLRYFAAVVP